MPKAKCWTVILAAVVSILASTSLEASCWQCAAVSGYATCISAGSTMGRTQCSAAMYCLSTCRTNCSLGGGSCSGSSDCHIIGDELFCITPATRDTELRTPNGGPWEVPGVEAASQRCA